jgi:hypothetical protein
MKNFIFPRLLCAAAFLCVLYSSCPQPVNYSAYRLEMPELPAAWTALLGPPAWRIEWVDGDGQRARSETDNNFYPAASMPEGWTTPVIAYPYWKGRPVYSGMMKPCGAIYPLDAEDGVIRLSWQGGVDAFFYHELSGGQNEKRQPSKFDWVRFRSLFIEKSINADVCANPWLADWSAIAVKTMETGFNARRIVPRETENLVIDIPESGPWTGTSPFAPVQSWQKGEKAVLQVTENVDSYFCPAGALHCKKGIWIFEPYISGANSRATS